MSAAGWIPPANPNPHEILHEAYSDTRAGRYQPALAKHVWFHENSLTIKPALAGTRLSFALLYWAQLAKQYPPALVKLEEIRDVAQKKVEEEQDVRRSFHELTSINRHLGDTEATAEMFKLLDEQNPKVAIQVFGMAQPSLVKAQSYTLINKYLSPQADFAQMRGAFKRLLKLAGEPRFDHQLLDHAYKRFANDVNILVAILKVNDRQEEAEEIATAARKEWDDRQFHADLEKALKGVVPDPWP